MNKNWKYARVVSPTGGGSAYGGKTGVTLKLRDIDNWNLHYANLLYICFN